LARCGFGPSSALPLPLSSSAASAHHRVAGVRREWPCRWRSRRSRSPSHLPTSFSHRLSLPHWPDSAVDQGGRNRGRSPLAGSPPTLVPPSPSFSSMCACGRVKGTPLRDPSPRKEGASAPCKFFFLLFLLLTDNNTDPLYINPIFRPQVLSCNH